MSPAQERLLLSCYVQPRIVAVGSKGIIEPFRNDLNKEKEELLSYLDVSTSGTLEDAINDADIFVGVSRADILTSEVILKMANKPIVFVQANPIPEITPDMAFKAGVAVMATGRSDFPNQVNDRASLSWNL